MSLDFLLTALIVVVSPGSGVLYTLAYGLSRGRTAAIAAALGGTIGILPHMVAAIVGLAALLHASALAFEVVKYAGVAYLLWMAWQTLQETGALAVGAVEDRRSFAAILWKGVLIALLNPKLSIFFLAFLPQFVDAAEPRPVLRMLELSTVFVVMTLLVFLVYAAAAAAVRVHVISRPAVMAWLRRSFAAAFVVLGARLALSER